MIVISDLLRLNGLILQAMISDGHNEMMQDVIRWFDAGLTAILISRMQVFDCVYLPLFDEKYRVLPFSIALDSLDTMTYQLPNPSQ